MGSDPRPPAKVPARALDRAALERVLKRAAELQASTADPAEAMTEAQLLALGEEVGLDPHLLRQALAEEQTRALVPEEPGRVGRLAGPAAVGAARTVRGTPERILASLDGWMQREECLQVKRRFGDRIVWEPRRDLVGSIKRGFRLGGRGYLLARGREVTASVVALDETQVLVRIEADLSSARRARLRWGTAAAAGGMAVGGGVLGLGLTFDALLTFILPLATAPAVVGTTAGYVLARGHRSVAARVQLALEHVLDLLEQGKVDPPPSLLAMLTSRTPPR